MRPKKGLLFWAKDHLLKIMIGAYIACALFHRASANAVFSLCRRLASSPIDIWALPLVWMDELTNYEKGLLRRGSQGIAYGPHHIGRAQSTENVCLPDINYYVFKRARVCVTSSSVILNDKQVIIERAIGPDQDKYDYAGSHILRLGGNTAVVRFGKSVDIKRGIFLGGNGASNYYHWTVEILAKLEFLSKLPESYQKFPLLVSEDVARIPSFKEMLDIFAGGQNVIVLSKELSYVVDELIYINAPNNLPFNLVRNQKFKNTYATIDSHSIDYLRKIVLPVALGTLPLLNYPKKIFLYRKSGIRNYNQDEVFSYLSDFGFTKIFMEDLSFLEQVRTVHYADFIVGPTGAAWTNLIFCRSGAKGLCWMADEFGDFSAYSSIAGMVGVNLKYLTYTAGVNSTAALYYKDYYIDLSMIKKGLSSLGEILLSANDDD